jgi:hypothetical protein
MYKNISYFIKYFNVQKYFIFFTEPLLTHADKRNESVLLFFLRQSVSQLLSRVRLLVATFSHDFKVEGPTAFEGPLRATLTLFRIQSYDCELQGQRWKNLQQVA